MALTAPSPPAAAAGPESAKKGRDDVYVSAENLMPLMFTNHTRAGLRASAARDAAAPVYRAAMAAIAAAGDAGHVTLIDGEKKESVPTLTPVAAPAPESHLTIDRSRSGIVTRKLALRPPSATGTPPALTVTVTGRESMGRFGSRSRVFAGRDNVELAALAVATPAPAFAEALPARTRTSDT